MYPALSSPQRQVSVYLIVILQFGHCRQTVGGAGDGSVDNGGFA